MFQLTLRNTLDAAAAAVGHALRRVGARREPRRARSCTSSPAATRRPARCWRATRSARSSPSASRSSICTRATGATVTGDRTEFIGRNGTLREPAALRRAIAVRPHRRRPRSVRRGAGRGRCSSRAQTRTRRRPARRCAGRRGGARPGAALSRARHGRRRAAATRATFWDDLLGTLSVTTPDRAMDLMLNRWLLYQTLACRIWGRSAFYQSSGAFGFRDQLQDVLALLCRAPRPRARAHPARRVAAVRRRRRPALVARARRPGRAHAVLRRSALAGLRDAALRRRRPATRALLDEPVPFLEGRLLNPDEHEAYERPVGLAPDGVALRALRARDRAQPRRPARTACRSWAPATGTTA